MHLKKLIPISVKRYWKLQKLRKKFPDSIIQTHKVGEDVSLGLGSALGIGVDIRNKVKIGKYSYINPGTIVASGILGNYCSVGYNCQIGMFEHPVHHMSTSPHIYHKDRSLLNIHTWDEITNPPIIGNDVWIGSNVLVLQGVNIGNGAIIAGGSVVTKNVRPYSVVAGVPAKFIKKRFDEKYIDFLENLKWWDLTTKELTQYKLYFEAKDKWVDLVK
ncbi:CatB-related O-acetyltransferase [Chengkuizengella sp. SCS-71B]|uniref:CatB-related O-acetyltransferase n=1 Tax=Chengkuizengella sp. SCS-71B TaxID=3115290 RepID=UPI0032C216B0